MKWILIQLLLSKGTQSRRLARTTSQTSVSLTPLTRTSPTAWPSSFLRVLETDCGHPDKQQEKWGSSRCYPSTHPTPAH